MNTEQLSNSQKNTISAIAINAIISYMHLNILYETLNSFGMLGTSGPVPCHIENAKKLSFKVVRQAMDMNNNISRYSMFQSQIEKFSRDEKYLNVSTLADELLKTHYTYISADYVEDNLIHIDAWLTNDDNEEGVTVATLNKDTLAVTYLVPEATYDIDFQKYVNELKEEITSRWEQ